MSPKIFVFLCAQVLLVQMAMAQSIGCGCGCNCGIKVPSGGTLAIVSQSEAPSGLAVQSQNTYEGCVQLGGKLPFLGSAAVQGCGPSSGQAGLCYACGNGEIGIRQASSGCGCGCGSNAY